MIQLSFPSLFFSFYSLHLFQKIKKKKIYLSLKKKKKKTFKFEHRTRERVGIDGDGTGHGESATPFYVNTLMIHRLLKNKNKIKYHIFNNKNIYIAFIYYTFPHNGSNLDLIKIIIKKRKQKKKKRVNTKSLTGKLFCCLGVGLIGV